MNNPLDFYVIAIERRVAQENAMFYPQKLIFDQMYSPTNWAECLCGSLNEEQLNSWAPPQIFMLNCVNHDKLLTLHLKHVKRPIFLTTYMQKIP